MRPMQRGTTLTELLAASTIGLVVLVALGQMDVARVRMYEYIRHGSPLQPTNSEGGFALDDILGDLKQADRVVLIGGMPASSLLIRIPDTDRIEENADLDKSIKYTWNQYTLDGTQIHRYEDMEANPCPERMSFNGITAFQVQYVDVAGPTLGGDPFGSRPWDNNVVRVTVSYGSRKVWGVATIPAAAYTNVNAGCSGDRCDSGDGLAGKHWEAPALCPR